MFNAMSLRARRLAGYGVDEPATISSSPTGTW